ncbi:hypothetical protein [Amycolatopsis orientalis]|uniref:hypothetical protein n=1 Tax=Amycolatopsis orientalis TaxID=31958 RepID=UPI00131A260A|nr:hypothetical protein [Amycolatopsis orientalis]
MWDRQIKKARLIARQFRSSVRWRRRLPPEVLATATGIDRFALSTARFVQYGGLVFVVAFLVPVVTYVAAPEYLVSSPSDRVAAVVGIFYGVVTVVLSMNLVDTYVGAVELGRPETLVSVQTGLRKFAAYWWMILLAMLLGAVARGLDIDDKATMGGASSTILLAASVGFVSVAADTRKELRVGEVKNSQEAKERVASALYPYWRPGSITATSTEIVVPVVAAGVAVSLAVALLARRQR